MRAALRLAILCLLVAATPAWAALSQAELATVQAAPAPGAAVPLTLPLTGADGRATTLGAAIDGRPALLLMSDWRCTQLCGSLLGITAQALAGSHLEPGRDFSLLLVGFNPDASQTDGAALRDGALSAFPELRNKVQLLASDRAGTASLERSLGFTAIRDEDDARYAHPAELYLLTADGRISRVLNGLSLDPDTLRLALVEAGQGRIGSLVDRLHVLCYGLNPLSGASNALAMTMLRAGAATTILAGATLGVFLLRRRGAERG